MSRTRENSPPGDPDGGAGDRLPGDARLDDALRRRFAAERAHDASATPPYARIVAPRRPAHRPWLFRPVFALGVLAIVIVASGIWRQAVRQRDTRTGIVFVPGQLRVPTDFLLDLASSTTTRAGEVPSIGAIDWYPLEPRADIAPPSTSRRN